MRQSKTHRFLLGVTLTLAVQTAWTKDTHWEKVSNAGMKAFQEGRYSKAEKHLTAALEEAEKFGEQDPRLATSLDNLAFLFHNQRIYGEAEPLLQRSLAIREKSLGPDHPDVARSLYRLAQFYWVENKFNDAEPLVQRSLAIVEKDLGLDHPRVAELLDHYADLLRKMDRDAEAEKMEARAKAIRAKQPQETPPK